MTRTMTRLKKVTVSIGLMMVILVSLPGMGLADVQTAVVATAAADYSSGAHSVIDVDPVGGPRTVQNDLLPTISDIIVAANGSAFYRIERFMGDNVTKFDISAPDTPIYQYSVLDSGDTVSANPHAMVFLNDEKAYLLRYGKTVAWIVNPSAATEAEFKIGELDLSAYGDADGTPEMENGLIVDGILYITLQRLDRTDNQFIPGTAYLAVFDTATDTEIDTAVPNPDGVLGIPLPVKNPGAIQYLADNDTLYIQGVGDYGSFDGTRPRDYSGGIATIDPSSYDATLLVDDGDDTTNNGLISAMAIVSVDKGYFVGYDGFGDNTVYSFSPTTGVVNGTVNSALSNKSIASMTVDQNGMLWVSNQTDAAVTIIDPVDDTVDESIGTNLNPLNVAFTSEGAAGSGSGGGGSSGCFINSVLWSTFR